MPRNTSCGLRPVFPTVPSVFIPPVFKLYRAREEQRRCPEDARQLATASRAVQRSRVRCAHVRPHERSPGQGPCHRARGRAERQGAAQVQPAALSDGADRHGGRARDAQHLRGGAVGGAPHTAALGLNPGDERGRARAGEKVEPAVGEGGAAQLRAQAAGFARHAIRAHALRRLRPLRARWYAIARLHTACGTVAPQACSRR